MCFRTLLCRLTFLLFGFLVPALPPVAHAYVFLGPRWPSNTAVVMHLEFGLTNRTLSDGFATWDDSAADALRLWNQYVGDGVQFQAVVGSAAAIGDGNAVNTVSYSSSVYGQDFGGDVLAVSVLSSTDDNMAFTEADVLFNTAWKWDSYRGALRQDPTTKAPFIDFHRVAIHEFGHVLGLDHPDEQGQTRTAIMNSAVSSVDVMQGDDIAGVQATYKALGRLVKVLPLNAERLLADPIRPRLYVSLPPDDAVAVVDTETLAVVAKVDVGPSPSGLAISPDNTRLYVASRGPGVSGIGVVDLNTLKVLPSLPTSNSVAAVAAGSGNRLYVALGGAQGGLFQLDGTTGAVQATVDNDLFETGALQISPDRRTLFSGSQSSRGTLKSFDVSTAVPALRQRVPEAGQSGQELVISHGGQFLCYLTGSGNYFGILPAYSTAFFSTADITQYFGFVNNGGYLERVAFSPDDALLYETGNRDAGVQIFDTGSFAQVAAFELLNVNGATRRYLEQITSLAVTSGKAGYLFIAVTDQNPNPETLPRSIRVFSAASNPPRPPREVPAVSVVGMPARGGFVVSRTGDVSQALKVHLHSGGAAVSGTDYVALKGKLKLPAGQSEAVIAVTLLPGADRSRKVKLFLDPAPQDEYGIGKAQAKMLLSALP